MPTVHFSGTYICHWQYFLRFLRYTNTGQFYCQKTFWNFWKIRRFLAIKLPSVGVSQKAQEILKLTYLCTRKIHSGHFRTYNQAIIEFLHPFLIFWALCIVENSQLMLLLCYHRSANGFSNFPRILRHLASLRFLKSGYLILMSFNNVSWCASSSYDSIIDRWEIISNLLLHLWWNYLYIYIYIYKLSICIYYL